MFFSCHTDNENYLMPENNCSELIDGLLSYDIDRVESVFNSITNDLHPYVNEDDPIGHQKNFKILLARLNSCELITSEMLCYACIKTYPPQSEILIKIDSSGQFVNRVVDILTPGDSLISFIGIHE